MVVSAPRSVFSATRPSQAKKARRKPGIKIAYSDYVNVKGRVGLPGHSRLTKCLAGLRFRVRKGPFFACGPPEKAPGGRKDRPRQPVRQRNYRQFLNNLAFRV